MDDWSSLPVEQKAMWAAGAALVVGLALAAIIARAEIGDGVTLVTLLLVPLIAYGLVSGRIREFSAPGGWAAKFQEAAAQRVDQSSLTDCVQDIQAVDKGGIQALQQMGQNLQKGKPVALRLRLGSQNYDASVLKRYIETLRIADPEMVVLFLDQAGGLVANAEAATVLGMLRGARQQPELVGAHEETRIFMEIIKTANIPALRALPGFLWQSISPERSNAEALQMMRELNARSLVVVDKDKKPTGIVKRDHIMAKLLVEMAGVPARRNDAQPVDTPHA